MANICIWQILGGIFTDEKIYFSPFSWKDEDVLYIWRNKLLLWVSRFLFFFNTKWVLAGNVRILLKQIMFETHKLAIIHFLKNYKKENPFSITFLSDKHPCPNEEVYLISINWNKKSYRTIKHERKPNNYQQLSDTIISSSWASHVMEHCTHTMH